MKPSIMKEFREKHKQYTVITGENYQYKHGFHGSIIHWDDANEVFYAIAPNANGYFIRYDDTKDVTAPIEIDIVPYESIVSLQVYLGKKEAKEMYIDKLPLSKENKEIVETQLLKKQDYMYK